MPRNECKFLVDGECSVGEKTSKTCKGLPENIRKACLHYDELMCPDCESYHIVKSGSIITKKRGKTQRYQCQDCGHVFTKDNLKNEVEKQNV